MTFQIVFSVKEDTDNPVNQSKHKAITCSPREVRENECKRVLIGWQNGASIFLSQSLSVMKSNSN